MKRSIALVLLVVAACSRETAAPPTAPAHPAPDQLAFAGTASALALPGTLTDFETFSAGAIDGQFDWKSLGGAGAPPPPDPSDTHCAVYDHVITGSPWPAAFGARSLRVSNAVTSGCYTDQTFSARVPNAAGQSGATTLSANGLVDYSLPGGVLQNHFEAEWTLASAVPGAQQPGLEVVASPARGDSHRMSWVQMADRADGIAVIFAERSSPTDPGAFQRTTVASGLSRSQPHSVRLVMDFYDGPANDVVRIYVDGTLRHSGTSWETYYRLEPNGAAQFGGNPPAVNRVMFRTGSDNLRGVPGEPAPATLGFGFLFDNLRIATFSVPRSADDCKNGGWRVLRDSSGNPFVNQGACVTAAK